MTKELQLNCSRCGAQQAYSPGQRVIKCMYCGSETPVPRPEDELSSINDSDWIVPLQIDKKDLVAITQSYMINGDLTPDDILEKAILTKQLLYYVPTYLYTGSYSASWTASFGYDRTEHYTEYVTRYKNGNSWQEPVSKTKTITDWSPVNGTDTGSFCVQVYAGSKLDAKAVDLVQDASLAEKITAFNNDYLVGFETEEFSLKEQDAYSQVAQSRINGKIDHSVKSHGQGDRQRDWHWTADINKNVSKVLMPIAYSIFEYSGKEYRVWIDGSDSTRMVGDELPVDGNKKNLTRLGFVPLIGTVTAIIIVLLFGDINALNTSALLALVVTALYGYIRKVQIIDYSKTIRNAMLLQKQSMTKSLDGLSPSIKNEMVSAYDKPKLPIFADTAKDKVILPMLTIIALALVLLPVISFQAVPKDAESPLPAATSKPPIVDPVVSDPPVLDESPKKGWASVYFNKATGKYFWVIGYKTSEEARAEAQKGCETQQGSACIEWGTQQQKCFAIYKNTDTKWVWLAFGKNQSEAMAASERLCLKDAPSNANSQRCVLDDSIGLQNASGCDRWSE